MSCGFLVGFLHDRPDHFNKTLCICWKYLRDNNEGGLKPTSPYYKCPFSTRMTLDYTLRGDGLKFLPVRKHDHVITTPSECKEVLVRRMPFVVVIGWPYVDFREGVARMNPCEPRWVRHGQFIDIANHMYHINFIIWVPLKVFPVLLRSHPRRNNASFGGANSRSQTGHFADTVASERAQRFAPYMTKSVWAVCSRPPVCPISL